MIFALEDQATNLPTVFAGEIAIDHPNQGSVTVFADLLNTPGSSIDDAALRGGPCEPSLLPLGLSPDECGETSAVVQCVRSAPARHQRDTSEPGVLTDTQEYSKTSRYQGKWPLSW